jgi:hypothetical protein
MINRISKKCFYELQILIDDRNVNKSTYGFNRQTAESVCDYLIDTYD